MALEDIEKLREKVAKDPNSRLFVPLADEYRKMGLLDEAIAALIEGLNNQPGYMSARVSLGKVYFEKKMLAEAKEEFEKVVSAIPDNLFAQKKLAETYRDLGEREKAIGTYKTVLKLNPLDEDSIANLEILQKTPKIEKVEEVAVPEPLPKALPAGEEAAAVEVEEPAEVEDAELLPAEEALQAEPGEELEDFMKRMAERDTEGQVFDAEAVAEETVAVAEEFDAEEGLPVKNPEKEAAAYADMFKEAKTAASEKDKDIKKVPLVEVEKPKLKEPTPLSESFEVEKPKLEVEKPKLKEPMPLSESFKEAERLIAKGDYSKAGQIYREFLSANPGNKDALQKLEELKMLLKVLGKEDDMTVNKLEKFGERLKTKKDEFLKNS